MAVPYTFATASGSIPLSQLDSNFSTSIVLGNTAVVLGNTYSTISNVTIGNCTIDGTNYPGYLTIPQDAQTGNYTLVAADAGKHIYHAAGSAAATYTIPANASVAYATGTAISFINMSANAVTISITSDTMYLASAGTTGNRTLAQNGIATAVKFAGTSWIISGAALT
jgi:hypothetical protein